MRRIIIRNDKKCDSCQKELKNGNITWISGKRENDNGKDKEFVDENFKHYCLSCGNKVYKQTNNQQTKDKCSFSGCSNLLPIKDKRFVCKDLDESFCSLSCFEKVCGVFCPYCGNKEKETSEYLQVVYPPHSLFQNIFPFVIGGLVLLITIVMTVVIKKQEKKWLSKNF